MKIIKTMWDIIAIIFMLVITAILCYVIFRMFTMNWMDAAKFDMAYKLAGVDGYVNMWIYDIRTAISTIL